LGTKKINKLESARSSITSKDIVVFWTAYLSFDSWFCLFRCQLITGLGTFGLAQERKEVKQSTRRKGARQSTGKERSKAEERFCFSLMAAWLNEVVVRAVALLSALTKYFTMHKVLY